MFKNDSKNHHDIFSANKVIIFGLLLMALSSCNFNGHYKRPNYVGRWQSSDGGCIILKDDSTYLYEKGWQNRPDCDMDSVGTWYIHEFQNSSDNLHFSFRLKKSSCKGEVVAGIGFDIFKFISGKNPYYFDFSDDDEYFLNFYKVDE